MREEGREEGREERREEGREEKEEKLGFINSRINLTLLFSLSSFCFQSSRCSASPAQDGGHERPKGSPTSCELRVISLAPNTS